MSAVMTLLSAGEAQRLTQRIKLTASSVRDGLFKLRNLVDEAKNSNVWSVLGFASWTAYLADTLADEPMRLGRDERQELVGYLSGEGLSTRAIAPIVGVHHDTVASDIKASAPVGNPTPAEDTASAAPVAPPVTGLDGKTYARPAPSAPRRRSLTDDAKDTGYELRKAADRLVRLREDDRFSRNKEEVAALLKGHLAFTVEVCQDLLDELNQSQED